MSGPKNDRRRTVRLINLEYISDCEFNVKELLRVINTPEETENALYSGNILDDSDISDIVDHELLEKTGLTALEVFEKLLVMRQRKQIKNDRILKINYDLSSCSNLLNRARQKKYIFSDVDDKNIHLLYSQIFTLRKEASDEYLNEFKEITFVRSQLLEKLKEFSSMIGLLKLSE